MVAADSDSVNAQRETPNGGCGANLGPAKPGGGRSPRPWARGRLQAQRDRQRQDSLARRHVRDDAVDQVRRGL